MMQCYPSLCLSSYERDKSKNSSSTHYCSRVTQSVDILTQWGENNLLIHEVTVFRKISASKGVKADEKCGIYALHKKLTPCSWALLERPPLVQLPKYCAAFHNIHRFISVFTRTLHLYLSWVGSIQSIPPPSYLSKTHLHINHPPTAWSSWCSVSFWISH
jgi:hypothetical protein